MLWSKIVRDLRAALPQYKVVRSRGEGTLEFSFKARGDGQRPIYYVLIEYRKSFVLRNLNTGLAKSYSESKKGELLCMLRTIQQRQSKTKCAVSGTGCANRFSCKWRALSTTTTNHVKRLTRFTALAVANTCTKFSSAIPLKISKSPNMYAANVERTR